MTALAVRTTDERSAIDTVLDFAEEAFEKAGDGDLYAAANVAAKRAVLAKLISGPLWDEFGVQFVATFLKTKRFHVLRRWSAGRYASDDQSAAAPDPDRRSPLDGMYAFDGRWVRLGDMARVALLGVAEERLKFAHGATVEARFLERLAKGLRGEQKVADKYSEDDIRRIRKEVEGEEE